MTIREAILKDEEFTECENDPDRTMGYTDDELTEIFCEAVRNEISRYRSLGLPIARYDRRMEKAYLEYPDGHRVYVEDLESTE